jgi:folate-binding protein YgfZ
MTKHVWTLCEMQGPDSSDFLNRITTVPIKKLMMESGQIGFILSVTGKIRAAFYLWQKASNHFLFEVFTDDLRAQQFLNIIEEFRFGEKFQLRVLSHSVSVEFNENISETSLDGFTVSLPRTHYQAGVKRTWHMSSQVDPVEINLLIEHFQPTQAEFNEANPLECGYQDVLLEPKGCYPGQEVIEKMLTRGSPPRRLVLLEGTGFAVGQPLMIQNHSYGLVTSCSASKAIAFISKRALKDNREIDHPAARIIKMSHWV